MGCEQWLQQRVTEIIRAGKIARNEWHELFDRVWEDGDNSSAEADQMNRLLQAMNDGKVIPEK